MKIPLLKNTLTNYLSMGVRLIQGVLITRWMIAELGEANYGLWMMLWSFFCYSLLLDFGLGVAAQKATATELWKRDIQKYNITISTVSSSILPCRSSSLPGRSSPPASSANF